MGRRNQKAQTSLQEDLFFLCRRRFGDQCVAEYRGAVPGREFRIDIAFPAKHLAIEFDGWAHHGRFKADFQRDRERQNLLTLNGWRILRFTAKDYHRDAWGILDLIAQSLAGGKSTTGSNTSIASSPPTSIRHPNPIGSPRNQGNTTPSQH